MQGIKNCLLFYLLRPPSPASESAWLYGVKECQCQWQPSGRGTPALLSPPKDLAQPRAGGQPHLTGEEEGVYINMYVCNVSVSNRISPLSCMYEYMYAKCGYIAHHVYLYLPEMWPL